ncbi:MAG TPA: ribonucleotide reductase N-terminal alpha domain-containing protein, partial [Caldisericia bacterium]|nr:ribonucleotide reductase N-terminal alpha domain-containing protein [Caldisericia bacterium]
MENKIDLTPQAKLVLEKRYLKKNDKGEVIETPFEMFERVARVISNIDRFYNKDVDIEKTYENFLNVMINLEFLPNSPTLMNAGRELGLLSACFVLPVDDSLNEIFDSLKYTALIHQGGG